MKNFFLILLFSSFLGLFGCSSLELESISSSKEETQRILSLGLTHEENLIEASKLKTPHMVSVVSLQLTNARAQKLQEPRIGLGTLGRGNWDGETGEAPWVV